MVSRAPRFLRITFSMVHSTSSPPRICLIGISGYAAVYVEWLLEAQAGGRIEIAAFVALKKEHSLPAAKRLAATGATLYDDYRTLFENEKNRIDLCYIPTGIQWHARMTVAALRAGCNVLVEKPLAGSLEDARRVQEAERLTGRWVAVGFQDMYTDEIKSLKKEILDGLVGPIQSVSMVGIWPRPQSYYQRNNWAGRLAADSASALDSPLNNAFAHFVNLALYLAGPKLMESRHAIVVRTQLYRAHDIESFDTAVVHAASSDNIRFWFGVSHASQRNREPSIRIVGPKGTVEWCHERHCEIRLTCAPTRYENVSNYEATRRKMFDTVLARLKNPDTLICDTRIASCHTALIEGIHANSNARSINPANIDNIPHQASGSTIPSIRELDRRLLEAFETMGDLDDIEPLTIAL